MSSVCDANKLQRLSLLRLTIRQNPLYRGIQRGNPRSLHGLCASLASQVIEAIAAFTGKITNIEPCGFFFSTALVECVYHLICAVQDAPSPEDRSSIVSSLKLSYQLLVRFSHTLDTAKRAIRALDSAVFPDGAGSLTERYDGDTNIGPIAGNLTSMDMNDFPSLSDDRNGSLTDMSLFDFLDDAADDDFRYSNNVMPQMSPVMGPGFWDMMRSLDGAEFLQNV